MDAPETASETVGARETAMRENEIKGMKRKWTSTWLCGAVHAAYNVLLPLSPPTCRLFQHEKRVPTRIEARDGRGSLNPPSCSMKNGFLRRLRRISKEKGDGTFKGSRDPCNTIGSQGHWQSD